MDTGKNQIKFKNKGEIKFFVVIYQEKVFNYLKVIEIFMVEGKEGRWEIEGEENLQSLHSLPLLCFPKSFFGKIAIYIVCYFHSLVLTAWDVWKYFCQAS